MASQSFHSSASLPDYFGLSLLLFLISRGKMREDNKNYMKASSQAETLQPFLQAEESNPPILTAFQMFSSL